MADEVNPLSMQAALSKVEQPAAKSKAVYIGMDDAAGGEVDEFKSFEKAIKQLLDRSAGIARLAFERDPNAAEQHSGLYRPKTRLVPDQYLKRIMIQDDLVATIVHTRSSHLASFGRPRQDRFGVGYILEPKTGVTDQLEGDGRKKLDKRIEAAVKKLWLCGATPEDLEHLPEGPTKMMTLAQAFTQLGRNAVGLGRVAIERIYTGEGDQRQFRLFRPVDASTIYYAVPKQAQAETLRREAIRYIERANEKLKSRGMEPALDLKKWTQDEYAYIQVIDGQPRQAFTADELVVHNFYPVLDVELGGYPVTPLDTVISAVTTHLSITAHNRLYFQSGRAARGMLVIKAESVNDAMINRLRSQFNAVINGSHNSWRMPVFGLNDKEADIAWTPLDSTGSRDMEFTYLADMNARSILSAFQMSPDELPGYAYLSRGTAAKSLAESDNEYVLEASRDVGMRPLVGQFEDIINAHLLPLIDPGIEDLVTFKMMGLEAETPEEESVRIQQDMVLHYNYDQLLTKVEKKPVGRAWGGELPLNPAYQKILYENFTAGEILEYFCDRKGASQEKTLQYRRDPFWFQWQAQLLQEAQLQAQQQMQAAQQANTGQVQAPGQEESSPAGTEEGQPGEGQPGEGQNGGGEQGAGDPRTEKQKTDQTAASQQRSDKLAQSLGEASDELGKSLKHLSPTQRRIIDAHRKTVDTAARGFRTDSVRAVDEILASVDDLLG